MMNIQLASMQSNETTQIARTLFVSCVWSFIASTTDRPIYLPILAISAFGCRWISTAYRTYTSC